MIAVLGCTSKTEKTGSTEMNNEIIDVVDVDSIDSAYVDNDSVADPFMIDEDILLKCQTYPELQFPIEEGDTVIKGVKYDWSVFESLDPTNINVNMYYCSNPDTVFYYGTNARIIRSDINTDTFIVSNSKLRPLMFEDLRKYGSDKESERDPYFAKFNIVSLRKPQVIDDTVRFELTNYWLDTDICWTFYYDFTAKGDSLYVRPVYESDYEDDEEY